MFSVGELRRRTAASARDAVRSYFHPLLTLAEVRILPSDADLESTAGLRPVAVSSIGYLRSPVRVWSARIRQPHPRRVVEARAALAWTEGALAELDDLARSSNDEYRMMLERFYAVRAGSSWARSLYYPTMASHWLRVAAWLLTVVEVAVVTLLIYMLFGLSITASIGLAAAIAVVITVVSTAAVSSLLIARFEMRPAVAIRSLFLPMLALATCVLCLIVALVVSRATGAGWGLIPHVLTAIATLIPILVALFQSGASLLGWSSRLERQGQDIDELRAQIVTLRSYASDIVEREGASNAHPPDGYSRPTRAIKFDE